MTARRIDMTVRRIADARMIRRPYDMIRRPGGARSP
jgi:hypothetical protein